MRVPAVVQRHPSLRWLLPIGIVGVAAAAASGAFTASATMDKLPRTTPSALLAAVGSPAVTGFSGTVVSHVSLGLPDLPSVGDADAGSPLVSLLSGSRTLQVWYGGAERQRVALLGSMDETDVFRSGRTLWRWDSGKRVADRVLLPKNCDAGDAGDVTTPDDPVAAASSLPSLTPSGLAGAAVHSLDATTYVSIRSGRTVADRAAYELVMRPRSTTSRIGAVHIAVDGQTKIPLGVQVYPRNSSTPAIDVSYTSIQFREPAATNFRFTPPTGAEVNKISLHKLRASGDLSPGRVSVSGADWSTVLGYDIGHTVPTSGLGLGQALTKVSGTWGRGRLLETNLLCALLTHDGRVYVGAVDPAALYAAAGHN